MKNIFLSASIPLPDRHPKYYDTADIIAIRDAVIALATVVLPHHRIIWGGHPSITPLIYYVMERFVINELEREDRALHFTEKERGLIDSKLKSNIQNHVTLYQSLFFENDFPPENRKFENVILTANLGDIPSSIQLMRQKMLTENSFSAAIFIGGMDGIEVEYNMFKEYHPNALILPLASTGAATKLLYDDMINPNERFLNDYAFTSVFQEYLIDKI